MELLALVELLKQTVPTVSKLKVFVGGLCSKGDSAATCVRWAAPTKLPRMRRDSRVLSRTSWITCGEVGTVSKTNRQEIRSKQDCLLSSKL